MDVSCDSFTTLHVETSESLGERQCVKGVATCWPAIAGRTRFTEYFRSFFVPVLTVLLLGPFSCYTYCAKFLGDISSMNLLKTWSKLRSLRINPWWWKLTCWGVIKYHVLYYRARCSLFYWHELPILQKRNGKLDDDSYRKQYIIITIPMDIAHPYLQRVE